MSETRDSILEKRWPGKWTRRTQTKVTTDESKRMVSNGPGANLAKLLKSLGIGSMDGCSCANHAREMDRLGVEWCKANIDTIEQWLIAAGKQRGWLFGVAAKCSARQLIMMAIGASPVDAIHLHSSSLGIGDSICALYAVCGLAAATGKPVIYHSRHPDWLSRVSHPNVTIVPHANRGVDIGGGMGAYRVQIASSESRVKKYCQDLATAFKVPRFSGERPAVIDATPRQLTLPERYVLLAPFSCHTVREWPAANWRQLAIEMEATGQAVVAIGASNHGPQLKEIFDGTGTKCWHGESEWVCDMVSGAACLVTNDSGPAHLGGLLGIPTVCVHAGALPHQFLFDLAPSVVSVVGSRTLQRSDHNVAALASVPVDAVLRAVLQ